MGKDLLFAAIDADDTLAPEVKSALKSAVSTMREAFPVMAQAVSARPKFASHKAIREDTTGTLGYPCTVGDGCIARKSTAKRASKHGDLSSPDGGHNPIYPEA